MKRFRIGIDSYSLKPLNLSPFELLDWAIINGAEGVQFSEGDPTAAPGAGPDRAFLLELKSYAEQNRLYLEWGGGQHIPVGLATGKAKDIAAVNRKAATQAATVGSKTVRSCSGGLMRWNREALPTDKFLALMADSLRSQKSMLQDLGVVLAIETHFEFTSFELLRLFDMCGAAPGEYLGICLDTANLLTLLENPVTATERLLPWVVSTHIKDAGLFLQPQGLVSFTAEAGTGVVDFEAIFERLSRLPARVNLSLEDHGGDVLIPVNDEGFLALFPDLTVQEFAGLVALAAKSQELRDRRKLAILDRACWPEVCERRVKRGLRAIRRLVQAEGK